MKVNKVISLEYEVIDTINDLVGKGNFSKFIRSLIDDYFKQVDELPEVI